MVHQVVLQDTLFLLYLPAPSLSREHTRIPPFVFDFLKLLCALHFACSANRFLLIHSLLYYNAAAQRKPLSNQTPSPWKQSTFAGDPRREQGFGDLYLVLTFYILLRCFSLARLGTYTRTAMMGTGESV
jgi:hypothetical protein